MAYPLTGAQRTPPTHTVELVDFDPNLTISELPLSGLAPRPSVLPMLSSIPLLFTATIALPVALPNQEGTAEVQRSWTLTADRIHTVSGDVVEGGAVVVVDGKITAITPGASEGSGDLHVKAITPGLIDMACQVSLGLDAVEETSEATPSASILDALNLFSPRWRSELHSGVTTVLATGPGRNVIGGLGAVVKTGGAPLVSERLVQGDSVLWGTLGSEPSLGNRPAFGQPDLFNRRPSTRMGVEWVARKTFYEALRAKEDESLAFLGSDRLTAVLAGELPLLLRASATQDIRTAIYLKEEFEIPELILTSAAESWRELDMLERSGASVVLPPFAFDGRTATDGGFFAWNTVTLLDERGIRFALSGQSGTRPDTRLAMQPAFATRAGLDPAKALAAATLVPAQMLGVDARVGSLDAGKDADLALWNGDPTALGARVVGVVLNGELVLDPR